MSPTLPIREEPCPGRVTSSQVSWRDLALCFQRPSVGGADSGLARTGPYPPAGVDVSLWAASLNPLHVTPRGSSPGSAVRPDRRCTDPGQAVGTFTPIAEVAHTAAQAPMAMVAVPCVPRVVSARRGCPPARMNRPAPPTLRPAGCAHAWRPSVCAAATSPPERISAAVHSAWRLISDHLRRLRPLN